MATEIWTDVVTHYKAAGQVDSSGKMTQATVDDNNGFTVDRGASFDSKEEFCRWARNRAGRD